MYCLIKHYATIMYGGVEVGGQFHALYALLSGKEPQYPLDRRLYTEVKRKSHYTGWAILHDSVTALWN